MTLQEFFRKARRGRKWRVTRLGQVRCAKGDCPLAALSGEWNEVDAARALGLRVVTAAKIARAADSAYHWDRPWLLKQLGIIRKGPV